jgi:hypothetical protein
MSVLRPGEEALHYSDGSHRWSSSTVDEATWCDVIETHLVAHRETPDAGRSPSASRASKPLSRPGEGTRP